MQGKLHETLTEHEGQLFASMHSCREEYMRRQLRKRKRDEDPMKEVRVSFQAKAGTLLQHSGMLHDTLMCQPSGVLENSTLDAA